MKLKVLLPTKIIVEEEITKITAEAEKGYFCILPRHIDLVSALVPGILSFISSKGEEFLAIDEGILVKRGQDVMISTRNAVYSDNLESLEQTVEEEFKVLEEREKKARSALARLESDFARKFLKMEEYGQG